MPKRSRLAKSAGGMRRLRTPVVKNEVFAVHSWETATGKHSVNVWDKKGKMKSKSFSDWEDAEIFAQKSARKLGKLSYQVDTPSRPHVRVRIPLVRKEILRKGG